MSFMKDFDHLRIQMKDIVSATNNFEPTKVIGCGGFGKVYKGELSLPEGQTTVAFKKLDRRLGQGNIEFWKEIMMLSRYKHENLISLMHFCIEGDEMILVYEYASHGSLDRYLSDTNTLTWIQRLKICVGAARGIHFLHDPKETHQRVLHRDIKSANILLDENWTAKVSDFGLSKFGPANQEHSYLVSHGVGTLGYCDPLYMELGFLSKESDVYSFGVVLFEVLCGRLCYEYRNGELTNILVPTWRRCCVEGRLDEIILPGLKEQMDPVSFKSFSVIAYQCVKRGHEERPTMAEIVQKLEFSLEQQVCFENTPESSHRDQVIDRDNSYDLEVADDDPLPAVESLQILGEAFPGRELRASGYARNGTTSCNFEWVRHMEDRSVNYIDGAKQPNYLVTADDVDTYLAVEVQPMDDRKRKGELEKVFANDNRKIVCDPDMHDHIRRALQTGYAEHRVSLWTEYPDIWEPVTLVIKKDGFNIKGGSTPINEKFSPATAVFITYGIPMEFFIYISGSVERRFRVEQESAATRCSRDIIVLTMRCFIKRAVEKKKVKKKGLCF